MPQEHTNTTPKNNRKLKNQIKKLLIFISLWIITVISFEKCFQLRTENYPFWQLIGFIMIPIMILTWGVDNYLIVKNIKKS